MCELDYKATSDADNNPSGGQTVIFAVLEAWLMSPLHCVLNWEGFYIDFCYF